MSKDFTIFLWYPLHFSIYSLKMHTITYHNLGFSPRRRSPFPLGEGWVRPFLGSFPACHTGLQFVCFSVHPLRVSRFLRHIVCALTAQDRKRVRCNIVILILVVISLDLVNYNNSNWLAYLMIVYVARKPYTTDGRENNLCRKSTDVDRCMLIR